MTDTRPTFGLVLDCADPTALAPFWAAALDYAIVGEAGTHVALVPNERPGSKPLLHRVLEANVVKNRMHLHIETPDIEAEATRLEGHGATRSTTRDARQARHQVDPHGGSRGQRVLRLRRRHRVTPTPPATNEGVVTPGVLGRALAVVYGVVAYAGFLAVTVCTIAFLADIGLSRTVDRGPHRSGTVAAIAIDTAVLGLFAAQHSAMARPWFKRRWTRLVPPAYERSTYVVAASAALALVWWQWRPIDSVAWEIHGEGAAVLWALYGLGWFVVVFSTFLIDHFELFGLRQVYLHARSLPNRDSGFQAPLLYQFVRHPIMIGFLIVFWAAPTMTLGHMLFAALAERVHPRGRTARGARPVPRASRVPRLSGEHRPIRSTPALAAYDESPTPSLMATSTPKGRSEHAHLQRECHPRQRQPDRGRDHNADRACSRRRDAPGGQRRRRGRPRAPSTAGSTPPKHLSTLATSSPPCYPGLGPLAGLLKNEVEDELILLNPLGIVPGITVYIDGALVVGSLLGVVRHRRLVGPEVEVAEQIFGDSIERLGDIRLTNLTGLDGKAFAAPSLVAGAIPSMGAQYRPQCPVDDIPLLAHELRDVVLPGPTPW